MQHDVVALRDDALELDALTGVLSGHPLEVVDERLLAVADVRVVLDVDVARVPVHRFGGPGCVEHEVVEGRNCRLVALQPLALVHR